MATTINAERFLAAPCGIKSHEDKWTQDHRFSLSQDVFTNMMISFLEVDNEKGNVTRIAGQVIAVAVVSMCAFLQIWAAYLVGVHVRMSNQVNLSIINIAFEMFLTKNVTMPIGLSQKICGEYEQIESSVGTSSALEMPDGTRYGATDDAPAFYSVKMPGGSWDSTKLGPDRSILDESMYVARHGGPWDGGMGLLFILMVSVWFLTIMVEYRGISRFARVTAHFLMHPIPKDGSPPISETEDGYVLNYLTRAAKVAGIFVVVLRTIVATVLLFYGTHFLIYTTSMMELIMNSLALVFILEIDNIVFQATASTLRQYLIEDLQAVGYPPLSNFWNFLAPINKYAKVWCPMFSISLAICFACACRITQADKFTDRFLEAASVCMFMGPTPYGIQGLVAPAAGMCDSLLSTTCAPKVEGAGASHGPCVVTDRTTFKDPTVKLYADGHLFNTMDRDHGTRRPVQQWGQPRPELRAPRGPWDVDTMHNYLRKACTSMYQPDGHVDSREVDPDTGEVMNGAPFYCPKIFIFQKVFGDTARLLKEGRADDPTIVRSILDQEVQEAMLSCRMGPKRGVEMEAGTEDNSDDDAGGMRSSNVKKAAPVYLVQQRRIRQAATTSQLRATQARTKKRHRHTAAVPSEPSSGERDTAALDRPGRWEAPGSSAITRRLRHQRVAMSPLA